MNTLELMQRFSSTDELRPTMCHPYRYGEWICATDGHVGLMLKADIPGLPTDGPNFPAVVPCAVGSEPVDVQQLRAFLDSIPQVEGMEAEEEECSKCDGSGEVECEECGNESTCKECNGTGIIETKTKQTGTMVADETAIIELFGVTFFERIVRKLVEAADGLGCETVFMTSAPAVMNAMRFSVGEAVFCMMPCRNNDDRDTHVFRREIPAEVTA